MGECSWEAGLRMTTSSRLTQRLSWRSMMLLGVVLLLFFVSFVFFQERESLFFESWSVYRLKQDQIIVNPPPGWISEDPAAMVFNAFAKNGQIALLDDTLIPKIRNQLEAIPWIGHVVQIRRRYPAGLVLQLEYREPVCLVEVTTQRQTTSYFLIGQGREVLDAPDAARAKRLAAQFISIQISQYLVQDRNVCTDSRIIGALFLIEQLGDRLAHYAIRAIQTVPITEGYAFVLVTDANQFTWGACPPLDDPDLAEVRLKTMQRKIDKLDTIVKQYGSLNSANIPDAQKTL